MIRSARLGPALSALRERDYRLLAVGQTISHVGTTMQWMAQGWLVLELTGDPFALGIVAAAQIAPIQVLALGGGLIGDVLPRRATLIAMQILAALQALSLGLLVLSGQAEAWHVYLLTLGLGVIQAVEHPVRDAFLADLMPRASLPSGIAIERAIYYGGRVAGPVVAGVLIVRVGTAAVFLVNAASYVAALTGLLLLRHRDRRPAGGHAALVRSTVRRPLSALAEGLAYVRATPEIATTLAVIWLIGTFGINFSSLLPILVRDVLRQDASGYGLLMMASGGGSVIGAATSALRPTSFRTILVASATVGVAGLIVAFSRWLPLTMAAMMLAGWTLITMAIAASTIIQLRVPDALRGRVMALYTVAFIGPSPIGSLVSGALGVVAGVVPALAFGGLVSLAAAAAATIAYARFGYGKPSAGAPDPAPSTPVSDGVVNDPAR